MISITLQAPFYKSCRFYNRERQNRRLDSEHFRFAPRTCRSLCPRLEERKAERTGRSAALIAHRGGSPYASHEAARVHHAPRRRGGSLAVRGARAVAAQDAACRLCRCAASSVPTLFKFPQADGRTRLSRGPKLYLRLHPNTEYRRVRKRLSRARGAQG